MQSLRDVLPSLGTAEFSTVLAQALSIVDGNHVPLERACQHGGLPDPQSLRVVQIGTPEYASARVRVPVTLSFNERCGAGCGGSPVSHHHLVDAMLTIDSATGDAMWSITEPDPPCEF